MKRVLTVMLAVLALVFSVACAVPSGDGAARAGGKTGSETGDSTDAGEGRVQLQPDSDKAEEGVLRIAWPSSMKTTDVQRDSSNYILTMNIYDTLFETVKREDGSLDLVEALASDYSVSEDGRVISITLRNGVRFSDGSPLTAEDVAFTFTRMLYLEDSVQTDFADMILGADRVLAHETEVLEGIRVLDDLHLTIELKAPFTGYISMLAAPSCGILSKSFVTAAGDKYGSDAEHTLGSGPYTLKKMSNAECILSLNPYYWGETPSVKEARIYINAPAMVNSSFLKGDLDIINLENVTAQTMESSYSGEEWKDRIIFQPIMEMKVLLINESYPYLSDVRVRKAIQMAIDREEIIRVVYNGEAELLDGLYPRGIKGYTEENTGWLHYDPEAAVALLKEAGAYGRARVELGISADWRSNNLNTMKMIKDDLCEVGLNASLVIYDNTSKGYLKQSGLLMLHEARWQADYNDPDNFLYTFFGTVQAISTQSISYTNYDVVRRVNAARSIVDDAERMKEYAALEKQIVQEDAAIAPLFTTKQAYVLGDRIKTFVPYWAGWVDFYIKYVELY